MLHPADHKDHKTIGIFFAVAGVIVLATVTNPDRDFEGFVTPVLILGGFLLACSVAFLAVYACGVLLRDHELWRRSLDVEPEDGPGDATQVTP